MTDLMGHFFYFLETLGILSFAISGLMVAKRNDFDPVGGFIIACVTAFGGGTLRDILLDRQSIYWFLHPEYPIIILMLAILFYILKDVEIPDKWLLLPDTLGLGLFTVTGAQIALLSDVEPIIVAILATMTATFGGIMRDTLCNEVPILFRKHVSFYSVTSFVGALLYVLLIHLGVAVSTSSIGIFFFVIIFRLIAIRFRLQFV